MTLPQHYLTLSITINTIHHYLPLSNTTNTINYYQLLSPIYPNLTYLSVGDRVEVTGVLRALPRRSNPRQRTVRSLFRTHLDAIHFRRTGLGEDDMIHNNAEHNAEGDNNGLGELLRILLCIPYLT